MHYPTRKPTLYSSRHHRDDYDNLGYDYRKYGVLDKVLSKELYTNPPVKMCLDLIEGLIVYLIDEVKLIKKHFSFAHDKDTVTLN